ncbi:MAG TPA: class I tRNA ligase family protein, partial [Candidatus Saccharimonas sp.]|nr:class I tRNA ligase family protein [Candidatus Saccharimonas sp.]
AIHSATGEPMPVWVADYVLGGYGTGAIMAVPAHDERDYDFAKAFGLPVVDVMKQSGDKLFTGYAPLINSGDFNGLEGTEAKRAIVKALFDIGAGKGATKYKLRDWIFSRQHYWGEPIPVVHCAQCAAKEAQPKISLSFYDQPTWDAILGGVKTVESRALNPAEPDRFFGHIKAGDVVELVNKPADTRLAIKILEARHFDSVEALNADHAWATSVSETGTKKALAKQIADFASYAPDYMDRIKANGLVAWRFQPLTKVVPLPESALPLELPVVESYEPTGTGESPLAAITDWVNTTCPDCGGPAKRETDTMPNWAGSSWYYLRYMDPHNPKAFASKQNLAYWGQVDHYNGGMEHTTLHLLYSRFWHKFLYDQGLVPTSEPYAKRTSHGVILGPDGQKMSKSRGNVINPDHVIEQYGADTIRLYEMFMGPFEEEKAWSEEHLAGVSRFIYRVWTLAQDLIAAHGDAPAPTGPSQENTGELALAVDRLTHKTLQKVHHDIESMSFNTMVSALMEYVNYLTRAKVKTQLLAPEAADLSRRTVRALVLMLAPSAPHLAEELWRQLGETSSVHAASWPKYDPAALKEDMVTIVVQVNGKVRANLLAPIEATNAELEELARADANVAKFLTGTIAKTIVVPRKLVNFVVK